MDRSCLPEVLRPALWHSGVIFASPHSGRDYPDWFRRESRLTLTALRSSEDAFMDRLIAPAVDAGAVVLNARVPRSLIDVNRGPEDLDPLVVRDTPMRPLNPRTMAGLGVIPRVVSQGRQIRDAAIDRAEAMRRIDDYWRPYHAALRGLIDEALDRFGQAILIDMHSMPSEALTHLLAPRPQVVLGDRHGVSAARWVSDAVAAAFEAEGLSLRRNSPFAGAYVAAAYGRPQQDVHVVQVELVRSLYMNEVEILPHDGFDACAERIGRIVTRLADLGAQPDSTPIAAE